jgi:hypothetical protein
MPRAEFEPAISAIMLQQTYALERATIGIGVRLIHFDIFLQLSLRQVLRHFSLHEVGFFLPKLRVSFMFSLFSESLMKASVFLSLCVSFFLSFFDKHIIHFFKQ